MPVVDASVVVDWVAPGRDPEGPAAAVLARLVRDNLRLVAPRLLLEEVANALLTGIRRGRWDGTAADTAFRLLAELPVEPDAGPGLSRAWDLARRYDEHPIYDMVYLELAQRTGEVLITADSRLPARTGRGAGVVAVTDWLTD